MSGNRRRMATPKPYNYVTGDQLEERITKYDERVAEEFGERFKAHDQKIREDIDEIFAEQDVRVLTKLRLHEEKLMGRLVTFLYVVVGGTAAALAVGIVALVLALT